LDEIRVLSPTAILGYGFPTESFEAGLDRDPHIIGVDAGSTDPGPYYLGAGVSFTDRRAVKRDLALMLKAGRAYDPAVFAAYPVMQGYDPGLALHMGKILECASIAAIPGSGSDCMMGYLRRDHFLLEPLNPERRCTVTSVAAHTLYEKSNPYILPGPGSIIDLTGAKFEQYNDNMVKASGSRLSPCPIYTIKLEGARRVGYRTVSVAGARDPVFIRQLDNIIAGVTERVKSNFADIPAADYELMFHIYGKNGVMGNLEPQREITSHELGIVIEAVAKTQDLANTICSFARSTMLHYGYPGRLSTAGNLAFLYSPSDLKAGEVYRFSVHHLIAVQDPTALFPMEFEEL